MLVLDLADDLLDHVLDGDKTVDAAELVDDAQLDARAAERAETIAALAPLTLRLTKAGMRRLRAAAPIPDDGDLIRAAYGSPDFAEGVDAFTAKRAPRWTGSG